MEKDKIARFVKATIPEGASYVLLVADGITLEYLSNVPPRSGGEMLRHALENLEEDVPSRELPDA